VPEPDLTASLTSRRQFCNGTVKRVSGLVTGALLGVDRRVGGATGQNLLGKPATIPLHLRKRRPDGETESSELNLYSNRAAIVVTDVWTAHTCSGFNQTAHSFIAAMNRTLESARHLGIPVIFASSDDDLKRWEGKSQRENIVRLRPHQLPSSNMFLAGHDNNGPFATPCMCKVLAVKPGSNDPIFECKKVLSNHNQHPGLIVKDGDLFIAAGHYRPGVKSAVTSWGEPAQQELWNFAQEKGITHLIYVGFATNMCVINREFAMIQMTRLGLKTILVRDLTSSITYDGYNPMISRLDPAFTPAVGTRYAIEYIEERIAPTIDSRQILGAAALRA
jgi:nicotinamidase-related amidase